MLNTSNIIINSFSLKNPLGPQVMVVKTAGTGAVIRNNFIDTVGNPAVGTAQGIYLENGPDDVSILDNAFANLGGNRSTAGVLIGDTLATDASNNVHIERNTIQNVSSVIRGAYGVIANNVAGTPGLVVRDNLIDNLTGQWAHAVGLEGADTWRGGRIQLHQQRHRPQSHARQ